MSNNKLSGDIFEYTITNYLHNSGFIFFDKISKNKFNLLKNKIGNNYKNYNNIFKKIFIKINPNNEFNRIKITDPCDGKKGNVSDIELYNDKNENIGLSCKVNNISIKHQRPSSLCNQCGLDNENIKKYKSEYKNYNDFWFKKINNKINFDNIDKNEKFKLYKSFNKLTQKYLNKLDSNQVTKYYNFLINYNHVYVLKHETKKKQIKLYDYLYKNSPTKINSIVIKENHIIIYFNNGINVDLRLHNASKKITKMLSLKYDTKILNGEELFKEHIFEFETNINSILRYPGGKTRAIKILEKYIPKNITEIYSPFFGGGSFEIYLKNNYNIKIYANDKFELLINFWNSLKKNSNTVIDEIDKIFPLDKNKFNKLKKEIQNPKLNNYTKSAYFFALNRSSFSGSTISGGFSQEACKNRFNKSAIEKLKKIDIKDINFTNYDFINFLKKIPNDKFIFLDPPYYLGKKSKLYGNNGDLHNNFNHEKLYSKLKKKNLWLLCYNNCDYIKELYKDYKIIEISWKYGMNKTKISSEIIIISKKLQKKINN